MNNYLVGYKFGIVWDGETEVDEYTIVNTSSNFEKKEVSINTPFADCIVGKKRGDICFSNGNKFVIKYIVHPGFEDICKKRGIKYLYHFTSVDNLSSIMEYGILSQQQLQELNIIYDCNDEERLDNHKNFISCSVEYPNGILLNHFKKKLGKKYALLKVNIDVLNYKLAKCCKYNAATQYGNYITGLEGFFQLYEGVRTPMPQPFPSNEQSEILINEKIETQYIEQIIFETKEDEIKFGPSEKTIVNPKFFQYREKYLGYRTRWL